MALKRELDVHHVVYLETAIDRLGAVLTKIGPKGHCIALMMLALPITVIASCSAIGRIFALLLDLLVLL